VSEARKPNDLLLPLRLIFPLLFVGVYLSHLTLLRLPYYWDEAGYYIPAAYDFFRTGDLIPSTTLANAHPPLPSLYLALWWKSAYTPAVTRTAMCLMTAIALLAVYRLGILLNGRQRVAATATLLTALYPVWFAQSTLAHADMFAAAATLWGLAWFFSGPKRLWAAAACFALAAWSKETAIVTPLAIAAWQIVLWIRSKDRAHLRTGAALVAGPVTLVAWYAYYRHRTGFIFGNPEYLRYNATSNLSPLRIALALAHRLLQLTAHMNMFVPVICMLAAMLLLPLREPDGELRPRISPANQVILYIIILANILFYSVLGGALLTRYLLPLYPLVLLVCVSTFYRRVPYWWGLVLLSATAFVIGLNVNPQICAGRQPELRGRDPFASRGDPPDRHPLPGKHRPDGVAGQRRTHQTRTGLCEKAGSRGDRGQFLPHRDAKGRVKPAGLQHRFCLFHQVRSAAPVDGSGETQRGAGHPFLRFPP
jgi:hypothetical protein